ncbi:hypothetical protein CBS101457_000933 [Exobasidium rhododendri]|nr:hypothetical protein CBS101457_000933 [Exobasidium rhododendri]
MQPSILSSSDDKAPSSSVSLHSSSRFRERDHSVIPSLNSAIFSTFENTSYLETEVDLFRQMSRGTSHPNFAEPSMSDPSRVPQGEFSFQSSSNLSQNKAGSAITDASSAETSSTAFARLVQAQRAQQETQRQSVSFHESLHLTSEPPSKKRKGVAGVLVDGALSAALYTGAAAVTAYSLWSNWGKKAVDEEEQQGEHLDHGKRERLPPGGQEEPPPPYIDQRGVASSSGSSTKVPLSPSRPTHVFVSSRRRRPVFQAHKAAARSNTPKKKISGAHIKSSATYHQQDEEKGESSIDGRYEDDMFARMQSEMTRMIEEGNRALQSKVELEDEDQVLPAASPSKHNTLDWSRTEQRSTAHPSHTQVVNCNLSDTDSTAASPSLTSPQKFTHRSNLSQDGATPSARLGYHVVSNRSPASPYSRIPRLGNTSTPSTKRRI